MGEGGVDKILNTIMEHLGEQQYKSFKTADILEKVDISNASLSNNLTRLVLSGIIIKIAKRKQGLSISYRLNPYAVKVLTELYDEK